MSPICCIAFDLDDTFWDCKTVIDRAEQALYRWLEQHQPVITQRYSLDQLVSARGKFMRKHPSLHHDLGQLRILWLEDLAQEFGLETSWVSAAFERFLTARNQVELFPNVVPALAQLSKHYQLGVITNGNAEVRRVQEIGHFFSFAHSSAAAGVAKPNPLIFQQALKLAAVDASAMVYVGDDPEKDIIGANHAGLRTIWFNPTKQAWHGDVEPDAIMTNFSEIVTLIQSL